MESSATKARNVWIFKLTTTVWKASPNPYMIVPVRRCGEDSGEVELRAGIRVPYPDYSAKDIRIAVDTGRQFIPWGVGTQLDITDLNIGMKSRE